jgi:hypothetical protein
MSNVVVAWLRFHETSLVVEVAVDKNAGGVIEVL